MGHDEDSLFEEAMRSLELPVGLDEHGDPGLGESALVSRQGTRSVRTEEVSSLTNPMQAEDDLFLEAMQSVNPAAEIKGSDETRSRQAEPSRARRIRKGEMQPDLTLDLHGYTRDEALAAIEQRIAEAQRRGLRVLLVICGQGLHSEREAVLQRALQDWIRGPLRSDIVESAPASPKQGGRGAWWLFLRSRT